MVQQRSEPLPLPLPRSLPYTLQPLWLACPVLSPAGILLTRVPLPPSPQLLRSRLPGLVRRLRRCLVGEGALASVRRSNCTPFSGMQLSRRCSMLGRKRRYQLHKVDRLTNPNSPDSHASGKTFQPMLRQRLNRRDQMRRTIQLIGRLNPILQGWGHYYKLPRSCVRSGTRRFARRRT
ncbi:group II intron maturase-specific domain-containing protein [Paraburkholderia nodosa]|uniref:group II intron maturase-specific domain-containing protein n=1 Tax=Paraburkholderia nodosa TaxID=392320 RepID=UPI00351EF6F2